MEEVSQGRNINGAYFARRSAFVRNIGHGLKLSSLELCALISLLSMLVVVFAVFVVVVSCCRWLLSLL